MNRPGFFILIFIGAFYVPLALGDHETTGGLPDVEVHPLANAQGDNMLPVFLKAIPDNTKVKMEFEAMEQAIIYDKAQPIEERLANFVDHFVALYPEEKASRVYE